MMAEQQTHMSGWKMKLGSFLVAIGAVIIGSAEVAPVPEMIPWVKFIGFIVGGIGTAFLAWGAGHKLEKNRSVLIKKQNIPYYIQKIDPDELLLLKKLRGEKNALPKKEVKPPTL